MVKRSELWRDVRNFLIGGLYGASFVIALTPVVLGLPTLALTALAVNVGLCVVSLVLTYWF